MNLRTFIPILLLIFLTACSTTDIVDGKSFGRYFYNIDEISQVHGKEAIYDMINRYGYCKVINPDKTIVYVAGQTDGLGNIVFIAFDSNNIIYLVFLTTYDIKPEGFMREKYFDNLQNPMHANKPVKAYIKMLGAVQHERNEVDEKPIIRK